MKKKIVISFFIISFLFIHILINIVEAKYVFENIVNLEFKIEKPIIEINSEDSKIYSLDSGKLDYKFQIVNYDKEDNINRLNMEYYIEIVSNKLNLFNIKLVKDDKEVKLDKNKTEGFNLLKNEKQKDNYCLYVSLKDDCLENIDDNIKIKVYIYQKNEG